MRSAFRHRGVAGVLERYNFRADVAGRTGYQNGLPIVYLFAN